MENIIYMNYKFLGYELEIKKALQKYFNVFEIKSELEFWELTIVRFIKVFIGRKIAENIEDYFIEIKIKNQIKKFDKSIDYILFVMPSYYLSKNQIEIIEKKFKIKEKKIYLWDPVATMKQLKIAENRKFENYIKKFDSVYSFDKFDCENYGYTFRATFYSERLQKTKNRKYNLIFIGRYSGERLKKIEKIRKVLKSEKNDFIYFCYPFISFLFDFFNKKIKIKLLKYRKIISFKIITKEAYNQKLSESEIVVDLIHKANQKGATQRTFDSLYLEKKMITELENIKEYEFYKENNILLFSELENKEKVKRFLESDYENIEEKIIKKYSVDGWVKDIFYGTIL